MFCAVWTCINHELNVHMVNQSCANAVQTRNEIALNSDDVLNGLIKELGFAHSKFNSCFYSCKGSGVLSL